MSVEDIDMSILKHLEKLANDSVEAREDVFTIRGLMKSLRSTPLDGSAKMQRKTLQPNLEAAVKRFQKAEQDFHEFNDHLNNPRYASLIECKISSWG